MKRRILALTALSLSLATAPLRPAEDGPRPRDILTAMKKAASFYRRQAGLRGGYVYFYSLDFKQRWGEGLASRDQIWIQPPGTPTVGLAYLEAYAATSDRFYLDAATEAALAVAYGQLRSGGWTNCVDFDPRGSRVADYRNGKGRGRNNSSLDDGQSQSAIRLMMHVDKAHNFAHSAIRESAKVGLNSLLRAQFPNGGFPQVWTAPVEPQPVVKASYPTYDWRTEGRIKNYWDMYTLNDNVCGYVADTLIDAHQIYQEDRLLDALRKLGDFLILAQMPEPQPAWAQQYSYDMKPIWARKFEPPAIAGDESQEAIATLMKIAVVTEDPKYLEPIPRALAYLRKSLLADGRIARYYELQTNRPLYMQRRGDAYTLTYDDSRLPGHYGWKGDSRIDELHKQYAVLSRGSKLQTEKITAGNVHQILANQDDLGRWVSTYNGEPLVGQAKMARGAKYLSSERFSHHLTTLSQYLAQ